MPDTPPSEESAPVVIEEPVPQRSLTPPPVAIPEPPPARERSGLTADLSEVLSGLDAPKAVPSPGSDSLEFDLDAIGDLDVEVESPAPAPRAPAPAADPLSIAFSMDQIDLSGGADLDDFDAPPAATPAFVPEPAPPPQLPDDFDLEFGDIPAAPNFEPGPSDLDALEEDIDADLDAGLDIGLDDALGFGLPSSDDPLDDEDALADVDLGTGELDPDDLLQAMEIPPDSDVLDLNEEVNDNDNGDIPSIADALEAFGAPEIPDAMRLDEDDSASEFDPFSDDNLGGAPDGGAAVPAGLAPLQVPSTPPPLPSDADETGLFQKDSATIGMDDDESFEDLDAFGAIDRLGEDPPAPPAPPVAASAPAAATPSPADNRPYASRLNDKVRELAKMLENEGRFDDAALLFEVQAILTEVAPK